MIEVICIIIGLLLGFIIIYASVTPRTILKCPTLNNINNTIYIDNNGQCYKYYVQEFSCHDPKLLIPLKH